MAWEGAWSSLAGLFHCEITILGPMGVLFLAALQFAAEPSLTGLGMRLIFAFYALVLLPDFDDSGGRNNDQWARRYGNCGGKASC